MRIAVALAASLCLGFPGCYVAPGTTLQNHFKTAIPAGVVVEHYYCDAYKDPQFLWVLSPVKEDFIAELVSNGGLKPAAKDQELTDPGAPRNFPWWDQKRIDRLPERYYRDPDPNDGSYYRIGVDRENRRIYILFLNT